MCLGVPMQIVAIDDQVARCAVKGVEREVSLFMLTSETVSVGDYVMVHVGYAIQKIAADDARTTWELLDTLLSPAGDGNA